MHPDQVFYQENLPFALNKNPIDNKIYVGANNNYGYLERNLKGEIKYK